MTPVDYCYSKAAIPGSALYFSTRHLDPLMRDAIVTICAFYKEIEDITLNYKEASIAQTKLQWWRQQIEKIQQGQTNHPITQMLKVLIPSFMLDPLHFISIIDGLEQNLAMPRMNTFEEVVVHVMRTAGTREFLIATLLQKNEYISQEAIYQFSMVMELVNYLQHFKKYLARGLVFFADSELEQFKVTEQELQSSKTSVPMRNLLHFQSEKIERAYQTALKSLSPSQKNEISNIIVRSDIARSILKRIQSKQYQVLGEFIDINPLRCWWVSWRAFTRCML